MRFMIILKANKDSEAGILPPPKVFEEMGKFNEELVDKGIMLAGEGLLPSSKGARLSYRNGKWTVKDGPFSDTENLIAGFWIWELKSKEEAIEWAKRIPNPMNEDSEVEIRQIGEMEDFGDVMTAEMKEQEERLRDRMAERA